MTGPESALASFILVGKVLTLAFLLVLLRGLAWLVNMLFIAPHSDPLRHLPGPEGKRLENHFKITNPQRSPALHKEWVESYGKTFKFHGFGKHDYRLMSFDPAVYTHVLTSPVYEKPWQSQRLLRRLIGSGITTLEGAEHRTKRKIISPAFSPKAIKAMSPVFFRKALELRDKWDSLLSSSRESENSSSLDVAHWLSRSSFDAVGLAGLEYHFRAIDEDQDEVYRAYRAMFNVMDRGLGLRGLISLYFPIVDRLWPDEPTKIISESQRIIRDAGRAIVKKKTAAILSEKGHANSIHDKDILSLLIKSNMSTEVSPDTRLSDDEILDQITTFLFGGSDSPSLTMAYCLHFLSQHNEIQDKLRQEIANAFTSATLRRTKINGKSREGTPDSGFAENLAVEENNTETNSDAAISLENIDLDSLPLLDAVLRESLRLSPPVHATIRVATQDDWIPVSSPVPGSSSATSIKIRKGSYIHIPYEGLNYDESVWGGDAMEFNPERWLSNSSQSACHGLPGLHNIMSFSLGPHACPGVRFSISEVKAYLCVLLSNYSFQIPPGVEIKKYNAILTKPFVSGRWNEPGGRGLPLLIKPVV